MGIIDTVWDNASPENVAIGTAAGITLYYIWFRIDEHIRIRRLGKYGPTIKHKLPLGLDFVATSVKHTLAHTNLDLWRDVIFQATRRPTVTSRILMQRIIFTAEPENIKAMLATQFSDFGKGDPFRDEWGEFLGDSIFTTDGAQWHSSRQLLRPQFSKDRISDLHCFEEHFLTLLKAIANGGPMNGEGQTIDLEKASGRALDISDLFFRFTLDVTTDFLLGADTKSLWSIDNEFARAFNGVQHFQSVLSRTGNLKHFIPRYKMRRDLAVIESFINFYIDRALRMDQEELATHTKSDEGYTFLHELASATRDRKRLRDQIMAILLAGRDTTASTMSWAIYELSRNPDMVKKLRAEILDKVGGEENAPTYEHLKNMPYIKAILNETLRLYPVVPFNVRLALKDTTLPRGGGPDGSEPLPVLKHTPVAYSTLCMHRDPAQYPPTSETFADPDIFSPERWEHWHPKPHDYIPFNAGPRICIGQQFALTQMSYVLVRLFQKFGRVTSHMQEIDGGNPLLKADIVLSPGQGVKVSFFEDEEKS
ncbi:hypothetical protein NLU13_9181 [Sarocladium strictum]|uniref:Uncharacterized protein n=1 Tax=Sarocladium strictum TaxID=5046 RepID=A0AA39L3Y1_SARSR|nr:hypothetical protein NLU13_9181 [Sarocladium strictum]